MWLNTYVSKTPTSRAIQRRNAGKMKCFRALLMCTLPGRTPSPTICHITCWSMKIVLFCSQGKICDWDKRAAPYKKTHRKRMSYIQQNGARFICSRPRSSTSWHDHSIYGPTQTNALDCWTCREPFPLLLQCDIATRSRELSCSNVNY